MKNQNRFLLAVVINGLLGAGSVLPVEAATDDKEKVAKTELERQRNEKAQILARKKELAKEEYIKKYGYYKEPGSYGTKRITAPPPYVRNLSKTGIASVKDVTWLDVGLDFRFRYEYRDGDIRRKTAVVDEPLLLRTRAYLGVKEILDPFRFAIEVQDSRRYNSQFATDVRDVNEFEIISGYGELYFKNALGEDDLGQARPLSLKVGRFNFEFLDRRLIGNNEWRNTTNTFQGFQAMLGEDKNDWQVDLLALQPLERLKYDFDETVDEQWFSSAIGHWRKWRDIITLEPYYLALRQDASINNGFVSRDIHATALRGYGWIGDSGFNYDANVIYQFGTSGTQDHDAYGYTAEVGYTFDHAWKPRLSASYGYASGDRNPNDNKNERFERFFGFARPWSADDYVIFENISAPKIRLEFEPSKKFRVDTGYGLYWLASATDRFNNLNTVPDSSGLNRDKSGNSGDFVGHSFDIRARYKLDPRVDTTLGYSHFTTGEFVRNIQDKSRGSHSDDSDFIYVEVSLNAFE
ncbi:MAG: alginate export family protein [Methylovulum sp.]|nr:alginate export family protein [Methylovulum sp.]